MLLQRGNQSTDVLRMATRTSGGVGRRKRVMAGLSAKTHLNLWGVIRYMVNWGCHVMTPMSRDLLGKLPKLLM